MRGKVGLGSFGVYPYRITPAYAGKSTGISRAGFLVRDHPRVCGEKLFPVHVEPGQLGSPPRMRGKAIVVVKEEP